MLSRSQSRFARDSRSPNAGDGRLKYHPNATLVRATQDAIPAISRAEQDPDTWFVGMPFPQAKGTDAGDQLERWVTPATSTCCAGVRQGSRFRPPIPRRLRAWALRSGQFRSDVDSTWSKWRSQVPYAAFPLRTRGMEPFQYCGHVKSHCSLRGLRGLKHASSAPGLAQVLTAGQLPRFAELVLGILRNRQVANPATARREHAAQSPCQKLLHDYHRPHETYRRG